MNKKNFISLAMVLGLTVFMAGCGGTEEKYEFKVHSSVFLEEPDLPFEFTCPKSQEWVCYGEEDERDWTKQSYLAEFYSADSDFPEFSQGEIVINTRRKDEISTNPDPATEFDVEVLEEKEVNGGKYVIKNHEDRGYLNFNFEKEFEEITLICWGSITDKKYFDGFKAGFEKICLNIEEVKE
jgi:hypothetical protein